MTSPEGLIVASVHDTTQAHLLDRVLAEVTLAYSALFPRDADLDEAARIYLPIAEEVVARGREEASAVAAEFYSALRLVETGEDDGFLPEIPEAPPANALATSLTVTGPVRQKQALLAGLARDEAIERGLQATLGAVTRFVEGGPRDVSRHNVRRDPKAGGWTRRSGGVPCDFCAMLISRGPVYSESTGSFRAHDHCHCKAVPFFGSDSGWTAQAREYEALWRQNPSVERFRAAYRARYPKTKSPADVMDEALRSERARKAAATRRAKTTATPEPAPAPVVPIRPTKPSTGVAFLDEAPRLDVPERSGDLAAARQTIKDYDAQAARLVKRRQAARDRDDFKRDDHYRREIEALRAERAAAEDLLRADPMNRLARDTNPLFREYEDAGINCTFVAASYELRRRGFDVIARPRPHADPLRRRGIDRDIAHRWRTREGGTRNFSTSSTKSLLDDLDRITPEGGRGFIVNEWTGGGAHIFNYEKVDGEIVFIEGQTGADAGDKRPIEYLSRFRRGRPVWYMRVDDLEPTDELADATWRGDDADGLRNRSTPIRRSVASIFG